MDCHAAPAAVVRRQVDLMVDGRRLYGEWIESEDSGASAAAPSAAPLLFLHEGLGSVRQWANNDVDFPAEMVRRTGRPAFAYDRFGFGASDPLDGQRHPDYLYGESLEILPAVLDQAGIDRCLPIGHSDGASIALLLAGGRPDRVTAAVLEAPHVIVEERTVEGIKVAKAAFDDPNRRLRPALERFHGEKTAATFSGWADVWLMPEFRAFSMLDDLPAIQAPLLVIQGEDDEYGTQRQLDLIAAGVSGPVSTRMIPGCRHIPHFQATDVVAPLMADFILSQP